MQLSTFIEAGITPYHVVQTLRELLVQAGAGELSEADAWQLSPGGLYFLVRDGSSLVAFRIARHSAEPQSKPGAFRIAAAHTDSPCLHLRLEGHSNQSTGLQFGTELYGSPIVSTWIDRNLAIAGAAMLRREGSLQLVPCSLGSYRATVPNCAIHLNRDINKGFEYNAHQHLRAYTAFSDHEHFMQELAAQLACSPADIVHADLYLVDDQPCVPLGPDSKLLQAPRLDNLAGCHAVLSAFLAQSAADADQVAVFFNHEEIGSRSASGADSSFLQGILARVSNSATGSELLSRKLRGSFLVSVDAAHAVHPSYPERYDPLYAPQMGKGPVSKVNVSQRYASSLSALGRAKQLWQQAGLVVQHFSNKADQPCGSTIGPMTEALLGMPAIDMGIGIWAMHSIREVCSLNDQAGMIRALELLYGEKP